MKTRIFLVLLLLVVLAGFLFYLFQSRTVEKQSVAMEQSNSIARPTPTPAPPQRAVLLFAGSDGLLHPELREIPLPTELDERVRVLVQALLEGPRGGLAPIFPYAAELRAVFVDLHGRVFIDLSAPETPPAGSTTECDLVYGVVDTVLLNTDLKAVQLLFDGREINTLSGHLDLSRPLGLNKAFIGR